MLETLVLAATLLPVNICIQEAEIYLDTQPRYIELLCIATISITDELVECESL